MLHRRTSTHAVGESCNKVVPALCSVSECIGGEVPRVPLDGGHEFSIEEYSILTDIGSVVKYTASSKKHGCRQGQ
jgi:hypothetical protein